MRRSTRRRLALLLGSLGAACVLYAPALVAPYATGFGDYQVYHHHWEAARVAIERDGELPLWNPFECGGIPTFGNPDATVYHPLFLLSFLFGTTIALKIFVLLHAAAGLAGMYVLARRHERLGRPAAALAAVAWAGSGYFAWHCGGGHVGFIPFYLLPWLVLSWRKTQRDPRYAVAVAAILTLVLLGGGVYPFPFFLLVLALDSARFLRDGDDRLRLARAVGLAVLATALLAAFRLLPTLEHLRYYPRFEPLDEDRLGLARLLEALTSRRHGMPKPVPGLRWSWSEYGAFVGPGVLGLSAIGVLLAARARRFLLLAGALLFGALALGPWGPLSPWEILHRFPIYDSLKVPSRFFAIFLFYLALLAALGADAIARLLRGRIPRVGAIVAGIIVALVGVDVAREHVAVLADKWQGAAVGPREDLREEHFYIAGLAEQPLARSRHPPRASLPAWNVGTAGCYSGMAYLGALGLWNGNVPQVRLRETTGEVVRWGRTTRTTFAEVVLDRAGRVVFNQTYSPGWISPDGRVVPQARQPTIALGAGRHRVSLEFHPLTLVSATLLSIVGILLGVAIWRMPRDRLRRLSAIRPTSPLVVAVAIVLATYLLLLSRLPGPVQ